MKNKLILKILNPKNELEMEITDTKEIISKLVEILWSKYINNSKWISRKYYNYNYSDKQTITFLTDEKYKFRFENIPTSWGNIQDYKIMELLEK